MGALPGGVGTSHTTPTHIGVGVRALVGGEPPSNWVAVGKVGGQALCGYEQLSRASLLCKRKPELRAALSKWDQVDENA